LQPEAKKFLWDASTAAARVASFVAGKNLDDDLSDDLIRSAVERQLEIVGEACNRLARLDPETGARIPELGRLVAYRNVLAHGDAIVDDRLVWDLVQAKPPQLAKVLADLLAE
jgi:uncharacterized protein with HEPN domain